MSPISRLLVGIASLPIGLASAISSNSDVYIASAQSSELSNVCMSNPLVAAITQLGASHCSSTTPANTTTYTTSHTTPLEASSEDSSSEDTSSGGWSGPHDCVESYCVYANPSFAANRGIVIISDGVTANALANLPVFVDMASSQAADLLKSANINTRSQSIDVQEIPGKGRGLITSRTVHRGEQIMAYTPALVIHRAFVDELGREEQLRLLRDAVSHLPTPMRIVFWKQLGQTHEVDDNDILDIVMNNSFNLPLNIFGANFIGNFPEVSMYNHDCRPSVAFHLESGLVHRTHAVRTSSTGEELSISYVDSYRARDVRRTRTKKNWGFECACAQCTLPEALQNASDHRLWRIYEVENSLMLDESKATEKLDEKAAVVDRVELLLSLYQQERLLESHGAVAYMTAALNCNAIRRVDLAIKYALLALEASIVEDGAGSHGARKILALLDEPERHWSWGRRL